MTTIDLTIDEDRLVVAYCLLLHDGNEKKKYTLAAATLKKKFGIIYDALLIKRVRSQVQGLIDEGSESLECFPSIHPSIHLNSFCFTLFELSCANFRTVQRFWEILSK